MKNRIMLDLETMDNRPGGAIVAIGAVRIPEPGQPLDNDTLYTLIDLESCTENGLTIGADTLMWWLQQSEEARRELYAPGWRGKKISEALEEFKNWAAFDTLSGQKPIQEIWGNGSDFDNALLAEAFLRCDMQIPWKFTANRCFRTFKARFGHLIERKPANNHCAIDDALNQTETLLRIEARLREIGALKS